MFGLKEGFEDVIGRAKQTDTAHRLARYMAPRGKVVVRSEGCHSA